MELSAEFMASIQDAASKAGMEPEAWLERAAFRQALYEMDPDIARDIIAGLDAEENGDFVSEEEMESIFARFRRPNNG